jgi:hypothetical protein
VTELDPTTSFDRVLTLIGADGTGASSRLGSMA